MPEEHFSDLCENGTYQDTPPLIVQTNGPWQVASVISYR